MLGGAGYVFYTPLTLVYGGLLVLSFLGFYLLLFFAVDWSEVPKDYFSWLCFFGEVLLLNELLFSCVTRRRKHSLRFGRRSLRQIKFSERLDNGGALFYNFDYRTDCVGTFGVVGSAAASPRAPLGKSGRKIRKQALTRGRNAPSRGEET